MEHSEKPVVFLELVNLVTTLCQMRLNKLRLLSLHGFHLVDDFVRQNFILLFQP